MSVFPLDLVLGRVNRAFSSFVHQVHAKEEKRQSEDQKSSFIISSVSGSLTFLTRALGVTLLLNR